MHILDESQAKNLLKKNGIPTTKFVVVNEYDELNDINLNYPLVMKVCSKKIMHKTDVGGVILNITNEQQLKKNFLFLKEKFGEKILIEEMEEKGIEIIIGTTKDEFFDKVIMVGIGGIFTEIYKDVSFRKIPITRKDAEEMLKELKAYKVIEGVRGQRGVNEELFIDIVWRLSGLLEAAPEIAEMDLNPLIASGDQIVAVDARIRIEG